MLLEVILPLGVLTLMLMVVDQVRRLISCAILNGTIRKALAVDPPSARLLIEKLQPSRRWPNAVAGWLMLVAGLVLGVAAIFAVPGDRADALQLSAVGIVTGAGVLFYDWWVKRTTPRL